MQTERLFADTNLFLRYLTDDLPEQAQAFEQLIRRAGRGEVLLVTSVLAMAEIVWTLQSYYGLSKTDIQAKVLAILNTPGLQVAEENIILQAAVWYGDKNVDFIDAYNAAWALSQGVERIATFDRKHFARMEGIRVETLGK
jgi:predicted nucleic-acid-binding protein